VASSDGPRGRARAALKAHPDATVSAVAKLAKCSRATVIAARGELAAEARRMSRETSNTANQPTERRQRAQKFLKDALAHGPKRVSDVEEAAAKALRRAARARAGARRPRRRHQPRQYPWQHALRAVEPAGLSPLPRAGPEHGPA